MWNMKNTIGTTDTIDKKAKAQAEANKELSASITDELIKMKEAEAHYKNGWVTVQGADAVIADK